MLRQETPHFLPAIVLENFCMEAGYTYPNFQVLGAEGVVHAPVFAFKVSVDSIECVSTGQSKKKAKHSAAHGALLQLLERAKIELKDCPSDLTLEKFKQTEEYNKIASNQKEADKLYLKAAYLYLRGLEKQILEYEVPNTYDQNQINSVGKLQEVCMKNKWTPPKYEEINDNDLVGQEKIFAMNCEINIEDGILCEKGEGRSKKEAKRLSALKMLNNLEEKGLFSFVEEPNNLNNRLKKLDNDYSKEFKPAKMKIDEFYSNIDYDLNKEIDEKVFHNLEKESNYSDKLEELACYIECKTEYIDLLPIDNELLTYSTLVNLIPYHINLPIITGWAQSTESTSKSRNQAALVALTIFKTARHIGH